MMTYFDFSGGQEGEVGKEYKKGNCGPQFFDVNTNGAETHVTESLGYRY
jgi:hypothetical protein